ncbi:MAG: trypsin-like peptidase domain-containing protein, partial [Pseudomonadota bacterium]
NGVIVTAHHVVADARHIVVRLPSDGGFFAARLILEDKENDVAVLHIDANLPALELAPGVPLSVRQTVFAIGYPLDPRRMQAQSARGIVAGHTDDKTIQLDMALNQGNSGGPLVDEQDRVVGMVVARSDPGQGAQSIGFAVNAGTLLSNLEKARLRLERGEIAALSSQQRQSATVVDELVQRGVFHELREAADVRKELSTSNVQAALSSLVTRIDDPDLLAFVGGSMWNVYLGLWASDDSHLREAKLTRAEAKQLAHSFGLTAGIACHKAHSLDPAVSLRSPIVDVVRKVWPGAAQYVAARPSAATAYASTASASTTYAAATPPEPSRSFITTVLKPKWTLRASGQLRLNPMTDSIGAGLGLGLGLDLEGIRFRLGSTSFLPTVGVGYGTVRLRQQAPGTVTHSYFTAEIGVAAEVLANDRRRIEVAAAYGPGVYNVDVAADDESGKSTQDRETILGHGRFSGGYRWRNGYVGVAIHVFAGPTFWLEPVVVAVTF